MAKDPAFLFYPGDWQGGTMHMTHLEKGCYMDLLMLQFNRGGFTEAQAKHMLQSSFDVAWPTIQEKFVCKDGLYWNERLALEKEKRAKFTESRRNNAKKTEPEEASEKHMLKDMNGHTDKRMENENEDLLGIGGLGGKPLPEPEVEPPATTRKRKVTTYPTIEEMRAYFVECNYPLEKLNQIFRYYADANWTKANGNVVKDWKRTIDNNWFADRVKPAKITPSSKAIPKQDYRPDFATDEEQARYESYLDHGLKNLGPAEWGWIYEYQHRDPMKKHLIPDTLYMRAQDRIYTEKMAKEYAGDN